MKTLLGILLATAIAVSPTWGQSVEEGRLIAQKILSRYPKLKVAVLSDETFQKINGIDVHGAATNYPLVGFILPLVEWKRLTKAQQVSLTLYVEAQIAYVRKHPEAFSFMSLSADPDVFAAQLENIRRLEDDAWFIGSSKLIDGNYYPDRRLVEGDGACMHDELRQALKASDFRK